MRFLPIDETTGTLEEVPVTISPTRDGSIEVLRGLSAGDEIVRTGVQSVSDGLVVRRFTGFTQ